MIETMMLCLREGRNDPKDLERVLPVLDRRLYDGGDGGVVFHAGLRAEASADLEFGLGRPERLPAVVVRGRDGWVGEEGEDVVPVLGNALLEFVQLGLLAVFPRVDGKPGEQFVQTFLRLRPHIQPDVSLMPLVDGVPQEVKHVHAPGVIRKGLRRVSEVPQQVGDADLVVFHADVSHEIGRPAVRHPDGSALFLRREVLVHHVVAPAPVKGQEGRGRILEGPEPAVPAVYVDTRLVGAGHLSGRDLPPYHLVWRLGELPHGIQHVGYGALADVQPEDGLEQVGETLERDVLIGAQIRCHGHDVGPVGHGGVHAFRETPLAAAPACALDLHLKMVHDRRHNRERDVHHLPRGGDCRSLHVQRPAALRTGGRRIPALRPCHIPGLQPRAALMPLLPACLPAGRLPLGLRVRNAYRVPGGRDTAVGAGLHNGFGAVLKFRDPDFEFLDLLVLADKIAVQDINHTGLFVELLRELRGVKILGESHDTEELLAPAGQSHPVRLDAPSQSCVEVLFQTTKVRERFDIRKFNKLSVGLLNAIPGLSGEAGTLSCGGSDGRFWSASARLTKGGRRLIFSDPKRDFAEMGTAFEKVTVRWRMPRVILGLWSGQGHLSSYDNTMIKKLVLLLVIMFLFFPHIDAQNEPKNKDSIVVKNVDVYVEYCLSNDATIEFAIKNNIPIHYPILIINDEIISDENDIDIIRNTVTHTRKLCGITVCNRLGPYRIKRIMRYSSSQAEKKGIIAQDGVVAISLQPNTILDVIVLKTWLINNRKETSYLNDETDYR